MQLLGGGGGRGKQASPRWEKNDSALRQDPQDTEVEQAWATSVAERKKAHHMQLWGTSVRATYRIWVYVR
jgi:hypothetical protein